MSPERFLRGLSLVALVIVVATSDIRGRRKLLRARITGSDVDGGGGESIVETTTGTMRQTAQLDQPTFSPTFQASASYHGYIAARRAVLTVRQSQSHDL